MTWAQLSELLRANELVQDAPIHSSGATAAGEAPLPVSRMTRRVQPGNVFVALKGQHADGTVFARQAIERGAIAVVSEDPAPGNVQTT